MEKNELNNSIRDNINDSYDNEKMAGGYALEQPPVEAERGGMPKLSEPLISEEELKDWEKLTAEEAAQRKEAIEWYRNPAGEQITVFVACAEDDPRCSGGYTSTDGRSLCFVRETAVPVKEGAEWVKAKHGMKDGIYSMKCCCSISGNVMLGVGLVTNGEIVLITYLNKSSYGKDDLPENYQGIFYLDESAGEKEVPPKEQAIFNNNSDAFRHWAEEIKGMPIIRLGHQTAVFLPEGVTQSMLQEEWDAYENANNPAKKEVNP
jgi:hypothetical protein